MALDGLGIMGQPCQLTMSMSGCADVTESLEETLKVVRPSGDSGVKRWVARWELPRWEALSNSTDLNGVLMGIDYQIG